MRGRLLAAALAFLPTGCSTFPGAGDAGRRFLQDGYIMITAPVQVPALAAMESWRDCSGEEGHSKLWLPLLWVGYSCTEATLCALHTVDLLASPIHLVVGNKPTGIYDTEPFPMTREKTLLSSDTGELALYDVAGVAGAVIAWWFGTEYVPHLFHWFTD